MANKAKPQKGKNQGLLLPEGIVYGSLKTEQIAKPKKKVLRDWVWISCYMLTVFLIILCANLSAGAV